MGGVRGRTAPASQSEHGPGSNRSSIDRYAPYDARQLLHRRNDAVTTLTYVPLTSARLEDYLRFFETRAFVDNPRWASCYCYFPLHDPRRTEWAPRSASDNRDAVAACIRSGTARGMLAYLEGGVVGWCNAGPWSQFPMLHDSPHNNFTDPLSSCSQGRRGFLSDVIPRVALLFF